MLGRCWPTPPKWTATPGLCPHRENRLTPQPLSRLPPDRKSGTHPDRYRQMKSLGDDSNQVRRVPEGRAIPADPRRQVAALDELRDHEAESIVRATHIEDRHDVRVVQPGEDAGFVQVRLHIPGISDALGVRHLD